MTSTFPDQHADTRIFAVSALGSLVLHGLIIFGLASIPKTLTVEDVPATVRVTLLPTPEVSSAPSVPEPSVQPHTAMSKTGLPPMPQTPLKRSQPSMPPIQAKLTPSVPKTPAPLPPLPPAKPILKDTRASQAMKARNLMKMRVPTQTQQMAPSLPTVSLRKNSAQHIFAPTPTAREKRTTAPSLPSLPIFTTPKTLTIPSSVQAGPAITRPTILSSSKPVYPRVARESGWEGTVIVRTLIGTDGVPNQVKIQKSCGHSTLDQAAQDAVLTWTFQPAKDGNIPIAKWVDIPIKFDLKS